MHASPILGTPEKRKRRKSRCAPTTMKFSILKYIDCKKTVQTYEIPSVTKKVLEPFFVALGIPLYCAHKVVKREASMNQLMVALKEKPAARDTFLGHIGVE